MRPAVALLLVLLLSGCATTPAWDNSAFRAAAPRSILVVPVANHSLDVDAPNYLLSTLPVPLAEKGYYVFPVNTTKFVLEQEGFYEGGQIHLQPAEVLAARFGADTVLFVTINRWDARYALLTTIVTVDLDYRLVDKDGQEIWSANQQMSYEPQKTNTGSTLGNLIASAVNAALTRATPNYLPLARQANQQAFILGPKALPDGPYRREEKKK